MANITHKGISQLLARAAEIGQMQMSSTEIAAALGGSPATVRRHLGVLYAKGMVVRNGNARATRYSLPAPLATTNPASPALQPPAADVYAHPVWSTKSVALNVILNSPIGTRQHVTHQEKYIDAYLPNQSHLLPEELALTLYQEARMQGQLPAGTYAQKVLEQLLVDLSWSSSKLEGNKYTLLEAHELFKSGISGSDPDSTMLLNHKRAIEFMVDAVPIEGLTLPLMRNIHAVLMQDLLSNEEGLGAIRNKVVYISDTTYVPKQDAHYLGFKLESILDKARHIKNPIEAAFFLWIQIAYLQPFEDGNKRTSRLAANIPLMLYNCSPLSFIDVDPHDYAQAMLGVYEFNDASMAIDLFTWTYRRSISKYAVVMQSMNSPDPLRLKYRESLNEAMGLIVRDRKTAQAAIQELVMSEDIAPGFKAMLLDELQKLEDFNCGRYRLSMSSVRSWITDKRPH